MISHTFHHVYLSQSHFTTRRAILIISKMLEHSAFKDCLKMENFKIQIHKIDFYATTNPRFNYPKSTRKANNRILEFSKFYEFESGGQKYGDRLLLRRWVPTLIITHYSLNVTLKRSGSFSQYSLQQDSIQSNIMKIQWVFDTLLNLEFPHFREHYKLRTKKNHTEFITR